MRAASESSSGIACMPASIKMTAKPKYFHVRMPIRV